MAFLALIFRFGYMDMLEMEHGECLKFVEIGKEHQENLKQSMKVRK